ncbi:glycosyl hydrolase family 47-domain-containing protein [Staphylotrichum tortipilum]|uniref:alpha-1,2-Mannosidase n=1 Tax=Staphylotrichum tortipilum TaxID=2831512 RepID=A0AAN6RV72_9PEZI|nr:glycosyl hydrolase family 47-domain-containing protein [Staphylotrichum longicolle]
MPRFRRYRVLLVCAFVITVLLYHVSKNSQWDRSTEIWHAKPAPPATNHNTRPPAHQQPDSNTPPPPPAPKHRDDDTAPAPHAPPHPPPPEPRLDEPTTINIPQLKTADGVKGLYGLPTPATGGSDGYDAADPDALKPTQPATVPGIRPPNTHDDYQKQNDHVGIQIADEPTSTTIHWQKPKEWFPVPEESLIMLPTGAPKPIPLVQFAFGQESPAAKEKRELRLAKVKAEAQRAWSGYKKYAWTHDELMPVSNRSKDPFCGWAATLVDSLDTLWIMGLKDEFDDAVEAVKDIDFTTTPYRDDIPVFETIIRYLGGLVGAYDVTGGKAGGYHVLLDKAVELAEILMSVFDTPNRLPILYYSWKPAYNINPKRASPSAGVAELGSMSVEFTRLAQLTGKQKYYDAVARITNAFEELQNRPNATAIPGIFPENLDATGCNHTAPRPQTLEDSSEAAQSQAAANDDLWRAPGGYQGSNSESSSVGQIVQPGDGSGFNRGPQKRSPPNTAPAPFTAKGLPADWECVPQGLTPGGYGGGSYSMGGSQDSTYEYFPKQYLMLGGLEPKYRTMHEKTVDAAREHLLYRPMAKGDPDILFSAKAYSTDGTLAKMTYEWEVTHLTCFLGGMFGLGGKIFNRPGDVEIGKKLADGCVWAYDSMPAGVMPESSRVVPCKSADDCHFDQAAWYKALDHLSLEEREKRMDDYYTSLAKWKKEVKELEEEEASQKQAEAQKRQEEARRRAAEEEERRKRPVNSSLPGQEATAGQQRPASVAELKQQDTVQKRDLGDSNASQSNTQKLQDILDFNSNGHDDDSDQKPMKDVSLPPAPEKPLTHQEFVERRIKNERIPSGFVTLNDKRYILRPEAIESVWYMYRITGDVSWQEKGWRMFEAVVRATRTEVAHGAYRDVTLAPPAGAAGDEASAKRDGVEDSMESFWLAETLKYFYLLFAEPDVISLDEWVLNTEAHPFRRPK